MFTMAKMPTTNPAFIFLFHEAPEIDASLAKTVVKVRDASAGFVIEGAGVMLPEIPAPEV